MGGSPVSLTLLAGVTFTQTFLAQSAGVPAELGVRMGRNQTPFNCDLAVAVNGVTVLSHTYTNLKQRSSDWAVVFPLTGLTAHVSAGDTVAFSVRPSIRIGFAAEGVDLVGVSKIAGTGGYHGKFYMTKH